MEKARQNAEAKAKQLADAEKADDRPDAVATVRVERSHGDPRGTGGAGDRDADRGQDKRDFNVLAAKLQSELRQSRDNVPPEQYRRAVDEYFRRIAEELADTTGSQ